jgi:hypothetical protein
LRHKQISFASELMLYLGLLGRFHDARSPERGRPRHNGQPVPLRHPHVLKRRRGVQIPVGEEFKTRPLGRVSVAETVHGHGSADQEAARGGQASYGRGETPG